MSWNRGISAKSRSSDEEFIAAWQAENGNVTRIAKRLGYSEPSMMLKRRRNIEKRHGVALVSERAGVKEVIRANNAVVEMPVEDGVVLVGSDAHVWPGPLTTAQRAFQHFAKTMKPYAIVLNGDIFDGSRASRHPAIGWERTPSVKEELDAVSAFLAPLEAIPAARKIWTLGNHDMRFEVRIANQLPELAGVSGMHLKDHFPAWTPCWCVNINDDTAVKHRWHNGLHAVYNNTLKSGKTMVTGHLHSLKVTPWTDYNGTRYGVDTGTLADPDGDQFVNYLEAGPTNWRSGFVVLTFKAGRLMWPEVVCKVDDEHVEWRGELLRV
jgi:hypothetical protein